jgi:hypothetical protein
MKPRAGARFCQLVYKTLRSPATCSETSQRRDVLKSCSIANFFSYLPARSKSVDFGRLQLSGGRTSAVGLPACSGSGTICSSRCEQRQRRCGQNCRDYAGPARKMVAGIAECHPEKNSGGTAPARKQISNAAHNGTDGDEGGPVGHSGGSSRLVDSKPLGRTVP